jgi:hypothetical protein
MHERATRLQTSSTEIALTFSGNDLVVCSKWSKMVRRDGPLQGEQGSEWQMQHRGHL